MALERLDPAAVDGTWEAHGFEHLQRYHFALQSLRGAQGRLLDLGCGLGYGSFVLANGTGLAVTAVDLSEKTIRAAERKYPHPRLIFQQADALKLPFAAETFDFIVSFENIEHVPDRRQYLAACHRVMKSGGRLILSAPNANVFSRAGTINPFHVSEPTYDELAAELDGLFVREEEYEQSPVLNRLAFEARRSLLVRLEHRLRASLGRVLKTPANDHRYFADTAIVPLLPERRHKCQQFLLVCRRR